MVRPPDGRRYRLGDAALRARPFLLTGRYAADRAEVRYWEEAPDAGVVTSLALRLWDDHRASALLPDWRVVGVEVVDRETFHRRGRTTLSPVSLVGVAPF